MHSLLLAAVESPHTLCCRCCADCQGRYLSGIHDVTFSVYPNGTFRNGSYPPAASEEVMEDASLSPSAGGREPPPPTAVAEVSPPPLSDLEGPPAPSPALPGAQMPDAVVEKAADAVLAPSNEQQPPPPPPLQPQRRRSSAVADQKQRERLERRRRREQNADFLTADLQVRASARPHRRCSDAT